MSNREIEQMLRVLTGLMIQKVEEVHDYLQLVFSDGTILNVFNKYQYEGENILSIKGKKMNSIKETDQSVLFSFSDGSHLIVGLRDEDYSGPEAMELIRHNEPPIVWN